MEGLGGSPRWSKGEVSTRRAAPAPARSFEQKVPPAWDLVDIERYRSIWREAHGFFSLNMASSKGCSFRCAWCAKPIWGNQYLQRSAARSRGRDDSPEAHARARPCLVRR